FIEIQRAGDGTRAMIGLLARRAKQHMEGIADNLRDRAVVRKHDIGHACKVLIQKRPKHAWLKHLHQGGKPRNISEERCNFAALTRKIYRIVVASKSLHKIGRKISRERSVSSFGFGLAAPRIAQIFDVANRLFYRRLEHRELDRA